MSQRSGTYLWVVPSYFLTQVLMEPKAHQFDKANWLRTSKDISLSLLVLLQVCSSTPRLLYGSEDQSQILMLQVLSN